MKTTNIAFLLMLFFMPFSQATISYSWDQYMENNKVDKKTIIKDTFPFALSALNAGLHYKYGGVWQTLDSQSFFQTLNTQQRSNVIYGQGSGNLPNMRKEFAAAISYHDAAIALSWSSRLLSHVYAGARAGENFINAYENKNNLGKCAYHTAMGLGFTADSIWLGSSFTSKTSSPIKYGIYGAAITANSIEIAKEGYQAYSLWNSDRKKAWNHLGKATLAAAATAFPFVIDRCVKKGDLEID